jgi:hypothetical protein
MAMWGARGSAQYRKTNREYQARYRREHPEERRAYIRHYHANNVDRIRRLDLARRQLAKDIIKETKNRPCADCRRRYPAYVMDFDHVRGKKIANISGGRFHSSIRGLRKEIAKCDVVCSNCHREREHQRRNRRSI